MREEPGEIRAKRSVAPRLSERHRWQRSSLAAVSTPVLHRGHEHGHEDAGDDERGRVQQERDGDAEFGERSAEHWPNHVADEEHGAVERGDSSPHVLGRDPDEQAHGGNREHHGADATSSPEAEELPIVLGEGGQASRDCDDEHTRHVSVLLTEAGHDRASGCRPQQTEDRESADDDGGRSDLCTGKRLPRHVLCKQRQDWSNEAEAHGDHEGRCDEHPYGFRKSLTGGHSAILPACAQMPSLELPRARDSEHSFRD